MVSFIALRVGRFCCKASYFVCSSLKPRNTNPNDCRSGHLIFTNFSFLIFFNFLKLLQNICKGSEDPCYYAHGPNVFIGYLQQTVIPQCTISLTENGKRKEIKPSQRLIFTVSRGRLGMQYEKKSR